MLWRAAAAWSLPLSAGLAACIAVGSIAVGGLPAAGRPALFADADDRALVRIGKSVYAERCAFCHGRYLQGQPLWQLADRGARLRAPAEDASGPSWQRSDAALFQVARSGHRAAAGLSDLDDRDILASIAFIKARWPIGLRVVQALHNVGHAGMPRPAGRGDWRFPSDCGSAQARSGNTAAP